MNLAAVVLALNMVSGPAGVTQPTPNDVVGWAVVHQANLAEVDRPYYRYLWIPPWIPQQEQYEWTNDHYTAAMNWALNSAASRAGVILPANRQANGWMMAVDLRLYAPKASQLQRLITVWDTLAIDEPYFHVTKENKTDSGVERIPILAPHINVDRAKALADLSINPSLVYRADWFITKLLHTKYYEFMGFTDRGKPFTQAQVYATLGLNESLVKKLNGDQRTAIFASGVAGNKVRRVDRLQGAIGRFNTGAVFQTFDVFDETVTVDKHPFYNLLAFDVDGGEAIFELRNGLIGGILYDGTADRNLVRVAPPNLVADHTIPAPYTKQLVPFISCIRCHGPQEGVMSIGNDVQKLLASGNDIQADFTQTGTTQEQIDRIAGLYMGDFSRRIKLARDDYTTATRRATIMPQQAQGMEVVETSALVSAIYGGYMYQQVNAETALRELGFQPGDDPVAQLNEVLPPQQYQNVVASALRSGILIRREDFEQIYASAMLHVRNTLADKEEQK